MLAIDEVGPALPAAPLCRSLGVARASLYRHRRPERPRVPRARMAHPRALEPAARQAILDVLHSPRFVDRSPTEAYATLLDEGQYLGSLRTMYRVLAAAKEVRERRNQLRHPQYVKPELLATAQNQIWTWDGTKLKGAQKWTYYCLLVMLDIFSRYVVGWMIAGSEAAWPAKRLIEESCDKQGIKPGDLIIHADRGTAMTSKTLGQLYSDLGIEGSHSRPHVSNDNPFSESQFRTFKYRPEFPDRFGSLEHARQVCGALFGWYNNEHRHSGIAHLTPSIVHSGHAEEVLEARHVTRMAAYAAHPERYAGGPPRREQLPEAVWINPPDDPILRASMLATRGVHDTTAVVQITSPAASLKVALEC